MTENLSFLEQELARLAARTPIQAYLEEHQYEMEEFLCTNTLFASQEQLEAFVEQLWEEEVRELSAAMESPSTVDAAAVVGRIRSCLPEYFDGEQFDDERHDLNQESYADLCRKAAAWDWMKGTSK